MSHAKIQGMKTNISAPVLGGAIAAILATGLIHFLGASDAFHEATYKGVLFALNGWGAVVAAAGIALGSRVWGWGLGVLIAGGAFAAYVASRTIGLPGLPAEPDAWLEPMGVASMVAEGIFLALAWLALSKKRS